MSDFDERSCVVACPTTWGRWWQTMEDVTAEVNIAEGTLSKQINCNITTSHLSLVVNGTSIINGPLWNTVQAGESVWTLEDRKMVRISLIKADKTAGNCWKSLLVKGYAADPILLDNMQRQLTLQRFQFENPGMDFSSATISGNYGGGGPDLPT